MTSSEERKHDANEEVVAILDAGAQYGKLIDRRVRELNVESVLIPFNSSAKELKKYKAIIISGGPSSVYADTAPKYDPQLFELNIPILAICYGFQLMVHVFHGKISRGHEREDGQFKLDIDNKSKLFANIAEPQISVLLTHGDVVGAMPAHSDFKVTATSTNGIIAAGENSKRKIYGVQFHPEVDLTPDGKQMFKNFLYDVCGLKANFTLKNRMSTAIEYIRSKVDKKQKVLCLVSGGVDSSVCCALLQKALSDQHESEAKTETSAHPQVLYEFANEDQEVLDIAHDCVKLLHSKHKSTSKKERQIFPVHIDHGFMRHDESKLVVEALHAVGIDNVYLCNAQEYFANGTTMIKDV